MSAFLHFVLSVISQDVVYKKHKILTLHMNTKECEVVFPGYFSLIFCIFSEKYATFDSCVASLQLSSCSEDPVMTSQLACLVCIFELKWFSGVLL